MTSTNISSSTLSLKSDESDLNLRLNFIASYKKKLLENRKLCIKSSQYYGKLNTYISIPTIMLTSIAGFISLIASSRPILYSY